MILQPGHPGQTSKTMNPTIQPVVTDLGSKVSTCTVIRYPAEFTLALNASDLRHVAEILRTVSEMYPVISRTDSGPIAKNLLRMALEFDAAANVADADKDADRSEAARHDAEVDAAQEKSERNQPAHD
jgi:hypothetical protein